MQVHGNGHLWAPDSMRVRDHVPPRTFAFATARWQHGLYSTEALAERRRVRELLTQSRVLLKQMQAG
jgi:hypothetical protein